MLRKLCLAALASLCFSTAASAQDIGAEPTYRELHLDTNFQPDPQRVHVPGRLIGLYRSVAR